MEILPDDDDIPHARSGHVAVVWREHMYLWGGYDIVSHLSVWVSNRSGIPHYWGKFRIKYRPVPVEEMSWNVTPKGKDLFFGEHGFCCRISI